MILARMYRGALYIEGGEVGLNVKLKDVGTGKESVWRKILMNPETAEAFADELNRWAKAARKVRAAKKTVEQKFYRPKKTWDERKQEEEEVRKEVAGMEYCSNCGELFMDSFSCSISHGMVKQQKQLVKKWDERDAKVGARALPSLLRPATMVSGDVETDFKAFKERYLGPQLLDGSNYYAEYEKATEEAEAQKRSKISFVDPMDGVE